MNEIQKENAKMAIEYYQKKLSNTLVIQPCWEDGVGRVREDEDPNFSSSEVRYFWKKAMIVHKGGSYPKPVDRKDIIEGKQYYVPDPLAETKFDYVTAKDSSVLAQLAKGRNMLHETKEAAIQHAKVMLGVSDE